MSTNAAAVAGVACLLLALGVGVLIGGLGCDDASRQQPAPQIITVGGARRAGGGRGPRGHDLGARRDRDDARRDERLLVLGRQVLQEGRVGQEVLVQGPSAAVKDLEKSSGGDYAKKSEKLPKTARAPAAAPPQVDKSKPIGGGSDTEEIG